jgi:hypothetical protein
MRSPILCLSVLGLGILACQTRPTPDRLTTGRWVDLSWDFSSETIYWPTAKPFTLEVVSAEVTPGGYYYAANNFSAAEHGGTHLDAPIHFAAGHHTTDQIPLDQLVGPAVVIDVSTKAAASPDYRFEPAISPNGRRSTDRFRLEPSCSCGPGGDPAGRTGSSTWVPARPDPRLFPSCISRESIPEAARSCGTQGRCGWNRHAEY